MFTISSLRLIKTRALDFSARIPALRTGISLTELLFPDSHALSRRTYHLLAAKLIIFANESRAGERTAMGNMYDIGRRDIDSKLKQVVCGISMR